MRSALTATLRLGTSIILLVFLALSACQSGAFQKAKAALGRAELPDMGPKLPLTIRMEIDPGLSSTRLPYINVCNAPKELRIGEELEAVLLQAAGQNFRMVQIGDVKGAAAKPDAAVNIRLQQSSFKILTDNVYDRLPAELNLEAILEFKDASGNMIAERMIKTSFKDRLIVEPTQHRCDLVSVDSYASNASVSLAVQFIREARAVLDPDGSLAASGQAPPPAAPAEAPAPMASTPKPAKQAGRETAASSAGTTPAAIASPSTAEPILPLPAAPKDLIPQGRAAGTADAVDDLPASTDGFRQPKALLLTIGIETFRDEQIPRRKFAAHDAELVAGYFQALGGISRDNVRVLQNRRALRADIEEAVLDWLPMRTSAESVVIIYVAGDVITFPTGDTYLVPYDGTRSSTTRLYSLKDLQSALGKLRTKLTLFIFDGSVLRPDSETRTTKRKAPSGPQWDGPRNVIRLIGGSGFQNGLEPEELGHSLFTYYFLRGLRGEADEDQDGEVTLGELAAFVTEKVPTAAKERFRSVQQPRLIPSLDPASRRAAVPLARMGPDAGRR